MRFAISIPQYAADGSFDPAAMRAYLARAEELGFHSGWTQEQVLGTIPYLGPVETLTYAAACTERLRLGCAVFITTLHSPVHLAKSLSTLDQLSRGRLEVGVGTGGRRMFSGFGVDPETFVSRFTEGLALMRALWTEPQVTFAGRFWQLDGAAMEPKPFQKPAPPVWFGANQPPALRRAVRLGDGFFGPARPPRSGSPSRWGSCGTNWPSGARTRPGSRSPSASTSRSTTTPGGAGSVWARRSAVCTGISASGT